MSKALLPSLPPVTPAMYHILLTLLAGDRHGYAIMQAVEQLSEGALRMGPGTLYGAIKRLLQAGLITETGDRPEPDLDDERRRYYRISAHGRQVVAAETTKLERLIKVARPSRRPA